MEEHRYKESCSRKFIEYKVLFLFMKYKILELYFINLLIKRSTF